MPGRRPPGDGNLHFGADVDGVALIDVGVVLILLISRMNKTVRILAVLCQLVLCCAWTHAQPLPRDSESGREPSATRRALTADDETPPRRSVVELEPPIYYLEDAEGRLQPVPGFTFEDFERLLELDRQRTQANDSPPVRLKRLSIVWSRRRWVGRTAGRTAAGDER